MSTNSRLLKKEPPSIKDIARLARVSHSTVSRAIANSPLVHPKTAEKIRRIARESAYRPSAAARSLVTRRSLTVGVVVTNITDPFIGGVVNGIEEIAEKHGFSVFLANSNAEPDREVRVVHSFEERRVDGIIVAASRVGARYVPLLSRIRVPIVLLNNQHASQFAHSVMIANTEASQEATQHLIDLGHRRIAYLGDREGYESETERFAGYRQALERSGLRLHRQLVTQGDGKPEAAKRAMAQLLAVPQPPTAVFCYNDMSALGAIRQIRDAGLRVPADISIIGFDDLYISQYLDPPLTTVRQPMRDMGCIAMQTLLRMLDEEDQSGHHIKVRGELIVRGSTAPPKEKL